MMLAFARGLPWLLRHPPAGDWFEMPIRNRLFELGQQELLVVGTGDIGLGLAERARGLRMVVNGVRRRVDLPAQRSSPRSTRYRTLRMPSHWPTTSPSVCR